MSGVQFKLPAIQKKLVERKDKEFDLELNTKRARTEEHDFIRKVTDSVIKPVNETYEKPLVIPLIEQNRWRTKDDLEGEAMAAVLAEANGELTTSQIAPIIQKNKVPDIDRFSSEPEKFKHDVSLRPEECSLDDYERVPVEQFGIALLRGMGWSEGQGIGRNKADKPIDPIMHKPRPHLLGLGADPAPEINSRNPKTKIVAQKSETVNKSNKLPAKPNSVNQKIETPSDKVSVKIGTTVKVVEGSKRGLEGTVVDLKERKDGTVLKLECSGEKDLVRVWLEDVMSIQKQTKTSPKPNSTTRQKSWLRPMIRVKIISKSFKEGRYYNTKGVIQDILTPYRCILKTDSGAIIDDVDQSYLETCIPSVGKIVMIVLSKDSSLVGQTAKLIQKNGDREEAVVQVESTLEIKTLLYDEICEYIE